jgi:hypothetical protein
MTWQPLWVAPVIVLFASCKGQQDAEAPNNDPEPIHIAVSAAAPFDEDNPKVHVRYAYLGKQPFLDFRPPRGDEQAETPPVSILVDGKKPEPCCR